MTKINKDDLFKYYIEQNLSLKKVADIFGVSEKVIRNRLKNWEISKSDEQKIIAANSSRRATNLDRYGEDNPSKSKQVKDKIKSYFVKEYGVENPFQLEDVKNKSKKTLLNKYGVEHPMLSNDLKLKVVNTNIQKYGKDNPFKSDEIKEKIKDTLIFKYGIDHPSKSKEIRASAEKTMLDKYGVKNPGQLCEHRDRILSKDFITKIGDIPITILAEKNDISKTTLYKWNKKFNLDENILKKKLIDFKSGKSSLEMFIEDKLNISKYNISPANGLSYRPDFKINDFTYLNVDGLYWHSDKVLENNYHLNLRKEFDKFGLRIIQLREDEIYGKTNIILSIINNAYGRSKSIGARKLIVRSVSIDDAKNFLLENHLMGYKSAKHIGLYQGEILFSILSYKINAKNILKIERFASKIGYVVPGALSRLLNLLKKNNNISSIESWVDLRYGTGDSLKKIGFTPIKETLGWKWTDYKKTYNRMYCRANMDERKLSEKEYAKELGLVKIYDAGQQLWRLYNEQN